MDGVGSGDQAGDQGGDFPARVSAEVSGEMKVLVSEVPEAGFTARPIAGTRPAADTRFVSSNLADRTEFLWKVSRVG
jgi:hypothetical protein